jgi:hypothetical protein
VSKVTDNEIIQALTAMQVQITTLIRAIEGRQPVAPPPPEIPVDLDNAVRRQILVETMGQPDDGITV